MIGVFDSGLGGLTVVREIMRQLPGHAVVYFGDTARLPYGTKGEATIRRFAVEDARFLLAQGAEAIVVACNTASAVAIADVRASVPVPVFEVVTPAARAAVAAADRRIGVIGTTATVRSGIYQDVIGGLAPRAKVALQACPLFVPLVEDGWAGRPETQAIVERYLKPLRAKHPEALVLGCTHYPFLRKEIRRAVGNDVKLIDPAREIVRELAAYLAAHPGVVKREGARAVSRFYVSDKTPQFEKLASLWLHRPVKLQVAQVEVEKY